MDIKAGHILIFGGMSSKISLYTPAINWAHAILNHMDKGNLTYVCEFLHGI